MPVGAQLKNISITVATIPRDEKGNLKKEGVAQKENQAEVFGFYTRKAAERLFAKLQEDQYYNVDPIKDEVSVQGKTDKSGSLILQLTPNSTVVVRLVSGEHEIRDVGGGFGVNFEIPKVKVMELEQVDAKGHKTKKNAPQVAEQVPGMKRLKYPYYMLPDHTRSNARFGLAVRAMEARSKASLDTAELKPFANLAPLIKDGEAYHRSQHRRKGYDIAGHDPLAAYCDTSSWMKTRKEDEVVMHIFLDSLKRGHAYPIFGTVWYEDYNTIYYEDSVCLDEGYDTRPVEFLEFNVTQVSIDTAYYKIPGKAEPVKDRGQLHLNFVTGQAQIDPADSLGMAELDERRAMMLRYYNDPNSQIDAVHIHGQASPDGGYERNVTLGKERSRYLADMVRSWMPGVRNIEVSSGVATWEDVANELDKDSLTHPASKEYAASVREITATVKDRTAQSRRVQSQPYYSYIRDSILRRLRVVDMDFDYVANKVRSREEIIRLYDTDPDYRNGKKNVMPYEYFVLFDYLKDRPKELEVQAAAAYKYVADPYCPTRKWPLAAYHLAQCYLKRDTVDIRLLTPYYVEDYSKVGRFEEKDEDGWNMVGSYNDPSIVCTQIAMFVKDDDIRAALRLSYLLPRTNEYAYLRTMLKCLNFGWNDPDVRDSVAQTSLMNMAVVYAAQSSKPDSDENFHRRALSLLQDSTRMPQNDPRVKYMQAQLRFRLEGKNQKTTQGYNENKIFTLDTDYEERVAEAKRYGFYKPGEDVREDFGYPLVECARLDENFVLNRVFYDGYFNKEYREAFKRYWKKEKERQATGSSSAGATE